MSKSKSLKKAGYPAVLVEWYDAQSADSWESIKDHIIEKCPLIRSVGFLIHEDEHVVILTQNVDVENELSSMVMQIPAGMVEKIYPLK